MPNGVIRRAAGRECLFLYASQNRFFLLLLLFCSLVRLSFLDTNTYALMQRKREKERKKRKGRLRRIEKKKKERWQAKQGWERERALGRTHLIYLPDNAA